MSANTPEDKIKAENALSGTLKTLFAVAENYPELKANQNFMDLQATLKEVEEKLQLSRRYYNATVRDFNTKLEIFPNNLIAGMFHFVRRNFFEIENPEERNNVKVSFNE
jgi:LemA protein